MYYLAELGNEQDTLDLDNGYSLEGLFDVTYNIAGTKPFSLKEAIELLKRNGYTAFQMEG